MKYELSIIDRLNAKLHKIDKNLNPIYFAKGTPIGLQILIASIIKGKTPLT